MHHSQVKVLVQHLALALACIAATEETPVLGQGKLPPSSTLQADPGVLKDAPPATQPNDTTSPLPTPPWNPPPKLPPSVLTPFPRLCDLSVTGVRLLRDGRALQPHEMWVQQCDLARYQVEVTVFNRGKAASQDALLRTGPASWLDASVRAGESRRLAFPLVPQSDQEEAAHTFTVQASNDSGPLRPKQGLLGYSFVKAPDLAVSEIEVVKATTGERLLPGAEVRPGEPLVARGRVQSLGACPPTPCVLRIVSLPGARAICTLPRDVRFGTENSEVFRVAWTFSAADSGGAVIELRANEPAVPPFWRAHGCFEEPRWDNNVQRFPLRVASGPAPPPAAACDLTVRQVEVLTPALYLEPWNPLSRLASGQVVRLRVQVANPGTAPAPASQGSLAFAGRYSDRVSFAVPAIAAGSSATVTLDYRLQPAAERRLSGTGPLTEHPATFTIRVDDPIPAAGPQGAIIEASEANNESRSSVRYLDP